MRPLYFITFLLMLFVQQLFGNGVTIINSETGIYLKLVNSAVTVNVENQVAVIKTSQTFKNTYTGDRIVKYAFPMPQDANATGLRWFTEGEWHEASIAPVPQDTTTPGPGGEVHPDLKTYLGETPLYYDLQQPVKKDSAITVELTYVQLLSYAFGNVDFYYPNDYHLIQPTFLERQELDFNLVSPRTIDSLKLMSNHQNVTVTNDGNNANLQSLTFEVPATEDYHVQYSLSLNELGLFSFSTFLPYEDIPDAFGGYFLFVAEPDPTESSEVISKHFTLIIDKSGSMYGDKITQARNAASFIVNNLNEGDYFNIVDFSTAAASFKPAHVPFNAQTRVEAITYINAISANGGTNISGAFETAIPQFASLPDSTANIVIFFTDGQATYGVTNTDQLIDFINKLVVESKSSIAIFDFGVGPDVNQQLLTSISNDNNGFAEFLGEDDLEERITEFYLRIRNPVLLNTGMEFSSIVVSETYPTQLPNLYKGQQMIVAGRYLEPVPVTLTLTGSAFGKDLHYDYDLGLVDTTVKEYQFLPKVWAKLKIEHLLVEYYILDEESPEAEAIKDQIIEVSLSYGVISPFTSFDNPVNVEENKLRELVPGKFELLANYPNPFNSTTKIQFRVNVPLNELVKIKIYDSLGRLIRVLAVNVNGPGMYGVFWDGMAQDGKPAASGSYFYLVDFDEGFLAGKMQLVK